MQAQPEAVSTKWLPSVVTPLLMILGGTLFLSLCSLIRIPLWFTPVPVTLQTFAVLLLGAFLGSRKGPFSVILFLIAGCCGLPLFAAPFGGVTMGFLLGFVIATYVVGLCFEKGASRHIGLTAATFVGGVAVIQLAGISWLGSLIGFKQALALAFYPFILVDLAKVCIALGIFQGSQKLIKFRQPQ